MKKRVDPVDLILLTLTITVLALIGCDEYEGDCYNGDMNLDGVDEIPENLKAYTCITGSLTVEYTTL